MEITQSETAGVGNEDLFLNLLEVSSRINKGKF